MPKKKHPLVGRKQTPEHIEKRAAAHRGKSKSEQTKEKISNTLKGRRVSKKSEFKPGSKPWNAGSKKYIKVTCPKCKKKYKSRLFTKGQARKYCSAKCAYADRGGDKHPGWQGGRSTAANYVTILVGSRRRDTEHRILAAKALGRKLKRSETVHHVNGLKQDNRNRNFVICSNAYHRLLERIMAEKFMKEHPRKAKPLIGGQGWHARLARLYQKEHFSKL